MTEKDFTKRCFGVNVRTFLMQGNVCELNISMWCAACMCNDKFTLVVTDDPEKVTQDIFLWSTIY